MGLRVASLITLWLALSYANEIRKGRTRNHGHSVCSTWGNNHFKTFDGDIYQYPGICEYNFASDCRESYKEFSVHIQRALNSNNHPEIQYILITIKDFTMYLRPKLAVVDGHIVKTPYYSSGVLIESDDIYTKVYAKLGLTLIWNQEDALMVELDSKFNNHTCGLCGDYNGVPIYNEFINGPASYNSITYGNLQKISKPNAKCEDPDETQALPNCNEHRDECERLLTSSAFADCRLRLNLEIYIQACMQDKCACNGHEDSFCLCSTISEYSRQCSHAGGRPGEWRTQYFCPKSCPDTMVYRESSSPCMDTCSHLEISSLCEEHYMDGCFCPEGTVYDDVTEKGCIPVSQCHCKLHGKEYSPGESITNECEECTCNSGRWTCKDLPCPGTCSVEGGSHITTFDGKKYTFHGNCYYVLAKGTVSDSHSLLAELAPCGSTDRQTCLKTVVLLVDHKKNVVVFRSDGSVLLNEMTVNVPHVSASFSVFKPSSHYLIVQTSFGLQLQIQLFPVMQLFATVDQSVQGKLQGLCGNFNGMEGDDFKTTSGLVEATGSAFANTWKAQSTCKDQAEKLEDPCSLSIESENYAEHWCSLLKNPEGPFARCHLVIDPSEYYKKCKYDTCLCEDNEECLCAALSSYSRACAFKGIILGGWRKSICTNEVSACPGNQIFLYNLTMCQQTCRSLADGEKHCLQDFAPVDGCGCPYNTYLDNQGTCVPISKCPCYYKGSYLEPGEYIRKDGERCVCRDAKVHCTSVTTGKKNTTACSSNKRYFDCSTSPKWTSQTPLQFSCHTPRADHFQSECVSGCVCPEGLFDDGKGGCVEQKDCPCIHNNQWYSSGQQITVDCNTCVCQKGSWSCTEYVCYGTCTIYGSGHYITFDGKFYDFDGRCDYVATQDFCGDRNSSGSFSIITENVPCGTTGVTCSKAIKMFLGKTELKLEDKDYKENQRDTGDDVRYWNRTVGLYLVIEASNGVMLIWDKKTTVFIKLTPDYKGKVCGLCGNFDDKSNNDFTTRSGVQETNALKFGNSWKQSATCPDVTEEIKPCDVKPHRESWAKKECNIIRSKVFEICHSKVDPNPFYDACVHDACSCDSGGDCECFCSAVAAYAQECTKAQACVFWRTPDICPIFCDYYNPRNECDWHYEPCGSNVTTCRMINNVSTNFTMPYLEGCYPRCPPDKPFYNEATKECVPEDLCWCYIDGIHVAPGEQIPTEDNCTQCVCGPSGSIQCTPLPGCPCVINGTSYEVGEVVAQIQDGNICIIYICAENGSVIVGSTFPCPTSTSPTTLSTSFPTSTLTTTVMSTRPPVTITPCFGLICNWTEWFDVSKPEEDGGDYETYDAIRNEHGDKICEAPEKIECRAKEKPDVSLEELGQKVECNVTYGLICKNEEQDPTMWQLCYNYEIRVNCCEWHEIPCETPPTLTPSSTTTSTTVLTTTTTRRPTASTTTPIPTPTITSEFTPSVTTPVTSTSPAPSSSTTSTVSSTPVSTTTTPLTPPEIPSSTTMPPTSTSSSTTMPPTSTTSSTTSSTSSTTMPPTSTTSSTTGKTTTVTVTTTRPPTTPNCECIWTDWIDVSYPNSSDRNSGDYETFENILKHNSSWVCAKAENISCRAERFPEVNIEDLGQKVECDVNTGLICNNSDQVMGGIVPMPVCLNYEISLCCVPDIPECITSTTTSTTTAPPSSTTSTVSSTPVSTTTPTPTPPETPSSTTSTMMPPSSTTSTMMPPSSTTSKETTTQPGTPTKTTTTVTPSSTPSTTTRTTETESTVSTKSTTSQQSTPPGPTTPVPVTTTGVTETGSTTKTTPSTPTPSSPTPHSTTTVTPTSTQETTTTGTGSPPTGTSTATISTTTSAPSSPVSTASTTLTPPPGPTTSVPVTTSGTTPTQSFTTTSGTTSVSVTTVTATTTTSEITSPVSTTTSGPTATSSAVTVVGSSTYSTVTPPGLITSPPSSTPGKNCSILPNESYAPGESWWLCECFQAICIEDNIIQVVPIVCNPPPKPTCANGLSPVQVIDKDGCCWHWECDCYCTGWGDPHYMTFDGLYYSYQGNCTYVLVEEINKKVDNFGVYIDNYHCDTRDVVSCPRTLIVRHETQEVRMATVKPNTLQVEVTVNKQAVALPYKKFGLNIYESGINRVVEIPELKMNVTYNGLSFSIRMPYSLFGNNTHGQCGTCNNNTADDCMLPNGKIAENCQTMADHWQVVDPSKPQCSPGLIPTKAPITTPVKPCKESLICELLLGSVFEPCHGFVQPEKYYAACVFDSCVLPNLDLECSSLQIYAATCADQSVCIDWRSHTNGVCCTYKCPSDKEYRACGPLIETTCKSSQQNETSTKQVEGCFCPNGTMLYDSGVDVCVKTCGCVGVDKIPREFGERFTIDCQDCICLEGGSGIVCEPHECAKPNKTSCDGEGFYEVNEVNSEDFCCPIVTCKCNTSLCTAKAPKCKLGFEVHSHIPSGHCCPVYECVPKRVCVHQNAEFLPNSSVFVDKCQNCFCTNEVNVSTQLNIISCEHIPCNTYCEPGYEHQPVQGECCGKCVQTKCVIRTAHNSQLILSPGEFKNDPYNNCTIYSCVKVHNQFVSSTSEITCPAFNEESCKPGTITFLPNGCCKTCAPLDSTSPCTVRERKDFIVHKGCRSVDRVVMTECEGTCGTFSLYSAEANSMDHKCSCCRESKTTVKKVILKCPNGHSISHKYIYVESCSCQDTTCGTSHSRESQSKEENDTLNRIKRAISLTSQ
ncbi:mucin-2 [Athene cunicularia]|uniref:mucin-2 n=1 Tax=Athene cunicularia TaxID=194338 RepID=UPI000EF72CCF|nr:mucin-2 [Athene cunicularia]